MPPSLARVKPGTEMSMRNVLLILLLAGAVLLAGPTTLKAAGADAAAYDLGAISRLAANPATKPVAVVLTRQLLASAKKASDDGRLCPLYKILGDFELGHVKAAAQKEETLLMARRGSAALFDYRQAIGAWERSKLPAKSLAEILHSATATLSLVKGPRDAALWLLDLQQDPALNRPEALDAIHAEMAGLAARGGGDAFLRSLGTLASFWKTQVSGAAPAAGGPVNAYVREFAVPHQKPALELAAIAAIWLFGLASIWAGRRFLGQSQFNEYSNYALWQKTDWQDEPEELPCARGEILLTNQNRQRACFIDYRHYEADPLTRCFIANASIPLLIMIFAVSLLGFGSIVVVNMIEGTLSTSSLIDLPFWSTISDPINWAVCVPLLFVFSRSLYKFIPYALNSFYENLLGQQKKKEMLTIVEEFHERYNKKRYLVGFLFGSFVSSAVGYIDLAQFVHIYGMQTIHGHLADLLAPIGIFRVPTMLGGFVIVLLTLLIYVLSVNVKQIMLAIFMFKRLYTRFEEVIRVNPFHSDRCGGLSFAGGLAIRMILIAAVGGLMGLDLVLRDVFIAHRPAQLYHWLMFPVYVTIMPMVFFFPVLHARRILLASHASFRDRLNALSQSLFDDFQTLVGSGSSGTEVDKINYLAERTEKFQSLFEQQFPTWPVRTQPLIAFVTAFLLPVLLPIFLEKLLGG